MTNKAERTKSMQDEISLIEFILKIKEWWRYLWSNKLKIIVVCFIGGALGLGYAFIKKPMYTATTTFVLESGEKGGGLGVYMGLASMMGIDIGNGGGIFQGDNILELYKSRNMIEKALFRPVDINSKQTLIERYININKLRDGWPEKAELKKLYFGLDDLGHRGENSKEQRLRDSVVGKIVENIGRNDLVVGKPDKKLSIIKVEVKSIDEIFAKRFNEELVKNVNDFYVQTKTKKSLENVLIIQRKTDSVRAVMAGEIYNAAAVADATPNLNPTRQIQRAAPIQRAQFSAETNKAVLGEMVKNLEMSKMALLKETPLIQVVDEPVYPLKKDKLGKAKGIVLGGAIFLVFIVIFLMLKELYRNAVKR